MIMDPFVDVSRGRRWIEYLTLKRLCGEVNFSKILILGNGAVARSSNPSLP